MKVQYDIMIADISIRIKYKKDISTKPFAATAFFLTLRYPI